MAIAFILLFILLLWSYKAGDKYSINGGYGRKNNCLDRIFNGIEKLLSI